MIPATAIVLAGGFGTRLKDAVPGLPKALAPVRGRPFLDYQLRWLTHSGIKKVILSTGYMAEKIEEHYGSHFAGMELKYSVELSPLGTGGAVRASLEHCDEKTCLVLNGDSIFRINLHAFADAHRRTEADCSLALRKVEDASRFGQIQLEGDNRISSFLEKTGIHTPGVINGGIYLLEKDVFLRNTPAGASFSIEKDFFEKTAKRLRIMGVVFNDYFIDIGIPGDYQRAQDEFEGFED